MENKENPEEKNPLNKPAIIARVNNTVLQLANTVFIVEEWIPADATLSISWKVTHTTVGEVLVASTDKGVCFLGFINGNPAFALSDLKRRFPANMLIEQDTKWLKEAFNYLNNPKLNLPVHLHLKGTAFQLNIWKKLMLIPFGGLTTYTALSNSSRNARATGAAVGANPVSYILPCHRAVRSDGSFDRYYWGNELKSELLAYEYAYEQK